MEVALLSLACILTLTGCKKQPAPDAAPRAVVSGDRIQLPADSPQLSRILLQTATLETVPQEDLVLPAKIEADPTKVSHITLPVSGRIRQVLVALGDSVRKGQPVLTVDSPDAATAMSAYLQAKSNIAVSKALLAKAVADLGREKDLFAHGAAAEKDVLAADAVKVQSDEALVQAQAAFEEAGKRLSVLGIRPGSVIDQYVTISSSVSGKVTEINAVGGELRNDTATPFITIADLSTVWVSADVPEGAVRFLRIGIPVTITINSYPGETFSGTLMRIGDTEDPQSRTIKVRAYLANPQGRFRPDMFASIEAKQGAVQLPTIPLSAVLQNEGNNTVFIERGKGNFQQVPVQLGWQGTDRVAIRSGVNPGERVVTSGGMLLRGY